VLEARSGIASTPTFSDDADDPGVELRRTADKGHGVFATQSFEAGDVVMRGRILGVLERNDAHATQSGPGTYVRYDGLFPSVNHSCQPNCGVCPNETGAEDLVARTRIGAGQEITFDYAMRNYSVEHFRGRCVCGEARCRGLVTGWKDLPAERKAAYRGYVSSYLLEMDRRRALGGPTEG